MVKQLNLQKQENKQLSAENQVKAGAAGGIDAVVKAINAHIYNVDACRAGCGALWVLVKDNCKTCDLDTNKIG